MSGWFAPPTESKSIHARNVLMRVQFAACGVGLGHVGRCLPIAQGLRKNDNTQVFFSTYHDAVNYVRQEGFSTFEIPAMSFKVKPDGAVDFRRTALSPGPFVAPFNFLKQVRREIQIMGILKPNVVVSDSRASAIIAAAMLSIPNLCILNQFQVIIPRKTHYLRLARFADAATLAVIGKIWTAGAQVMIPDFPQPYTISWENLHIPRMYERKTRLIGPILPVQSNALPTKEKLRKRLGLQEGKPLIFAPISGPLKERAYFAKILRKILASLSDKYQVVMSLGYPESNGSFSRDGDFRVFKWIPNRFEYLKASDVVISRAGHGTMLQTICYGKPAILVPTPSHTEQINNARRGVALGVAKIVEQDKLNKGALLRAIRETMENERFLERVQEIQKDVCKWDGLEIAIGAIIDVAEGGKEFVSA
jgi:UDP-N-acetylglucosamine--N-acetylmuramyl-(pentapeptide) pyrophosphoryl-undecaprenol N-acetylglucosamine transferase